MFMRENTHTEDRTDDPVHIRSSRPKWESNPNLKGKLDLRKVQIESFGKCRNQLSGPNFTKLLRATICLA